MCRKAQEKKVRRIHKAAGQTKTGFRYLKKLKGQVLPYHQEMLQKWLYDFQMSQAGQPSFFCHILCFSAVPARRLLKNGSQFKETATLYFAKEWADTAYFPAHCDSFSSARSTQGPRHHPVLLQLRTDLFLICLTQARYFPRSLRTTDSNR